MQNVCQTHSFRAAGLAISAFSELSPKNRALVMRFIYEVNPTFGLIMGFCCALSVAGIFFLDFKIFLFFAHNFKFLVKFWLFLEKNL